MALTNQEKQELLNAIKAESQSVDELVQVTSLDNINTLPAMRGTELVSAPVSLLAKPALDAAKNANSAADVANASAETASLAATAAGTAKTYAEMAAQKAEQATAATVSAVTAANNAATLYENTTGLALNGASARFFEVDDNKNIVVDSTFNPTSGTVVWSSVLKQFLMRNGGKYYSRWKASGEQSMTLFTDGMHTLKNKVFVCDASLYVWSDEENTLVEISGTGGGNTINVTALYPKTSGYHTLTSAISAVDAKLRAKGACITFESSLGKWETKQFVGANLTTWEDDASWEDFGGAGTLKSVTVSGSVLTPDDNGNVTIPLNEVEVDASLDATSTNAVQNSAVTNKLNEVDKNTVFGMTAELSDDETSVHLTLTNKSGGEIASADIPAGSGGSGGGDSSTTKIVMSASVDKNTVKEGDNVRLTYSYDHQSASGDNKGESTGQKSTITISVRRGSTETYSETKQEVSPGTYTLDLTKYLLLGTSDVYVVAETTDPNTGKTQRKQVYVAVKVVNLTLDSTFNLSSAINNGGFAFQDVISVPYSVSGTGTKTVFLFIDGRQARTESITRSGTTNGNFNVVASGLTAGRHNIQMVAEMEAGDLILRSESIYIDILVRGTTTPYIGLMVKNADGNINTNSNILRPNISVGKYEACELKFVAYDPNTTPALMSISRNGTLLQTVSVARATQTYQNRFAEKGEQQMEFRVGTTSYAFNINVTDSGIDIGEASYGLQVKLSPEGRSNVESNPAEWTSNGVTTAFEGFDWNSNGWTGSSLKLTNGAKAVIDYQLFKNDAGAEGMTFEMDFKVSSVTDRTARIISCISDGKGLSVTPTEASVKTGVILPYTNEDGEQVTREIKIGTKFAPDQWLKVAFVIGKRTDGRLMELYVNGNRAGADIYDNSYFFRQDVPVGITIDSDAADIEVRNIRIYSRGLSDDEVLENYIVDATTTDEMMRLWNDNDIMGETGDVDVEKLRQKGKGVLRIVRHGGLDEVNMENNKKTDFQSDVYFYSPFGSQYDFVLRECNIRIQGTSSTKYPSKNIRLYMSKGGQNLSMTLGGVDNPSFKYKLRPGAIAMNLFCMKSDYSDSSMSMNTGVAKLFNDVTKELGLLTPPQRYQYEKGGNSLSAVTIRQAIDGFPIDVFSSETVDGESTYYGQYNFNNEKSKSGKVFGMEGLDGFNPECPLTLETLNNGENACLFKSLSDDEFKLNFDKGLETNVPDDVKWAGLDAKQQAALLRLYGWIRACVPSGANSNSIASFNSSKFRNEVNQYFDLQHLLTYYIHTDYFAEVDQRAKNILLRTWDGLKWWLTYYDGDTQLGKRNDCFLAYDYTLDRNTYDAEASKYAFEGRDSWLWNLVLANFEEELKTVAASYRGKMTVERVLTMLDGEQMGNWSDRAYNKSGWIKYVRPAMQETYGKLWPFIYALQGSNSAFRRYFVTNRFALLDAKYGTNNFTSDNIDLYMARLASDRADTIRMTAGEAYAFGYGTNNSPNIFNTGVVEAGVEASIDIKGNYTVNDPLRVYGASRVVKLDMTSAADHLKNGFDLGKCTVLREIDLRSSANGSTGWWLNIGSCKQLRKVNLRNQSQAKTGSSTSTELDFSNQTKLEYLDARGTSVQSVTFAKGAPLTTIMLPSTLTVLKLEYLNKLKNDGLTIEGYNNIKTLIVDGCSHIDVDTLLASCVNVNRVRITGIDKEDDGSWLAKFANIGGVDASGNATDECTLVGTVRLTKYMEDEDYNNLSAHFPELNILQPEYTMIEFDDSVEDEANITNLDNMTGYKTGTKYVPSGHLLRIFNQRHRVLAKVTKKATQRSVNMAGADVLMNNSDGQMTYFPLDDTNSNFYADGTAAKLDGTEGDWMMYEPFFWSKGINDYLNNKKYSCYSSFSRDHMPECPEATVISLKDIQSISGGYQKGKKLSSGKENLSASFANDSNYSVCKVAVSGYRKVRFPTVPGTGLIGSLFTDNNGRILKTVVVPSISMRFEPGMYIIDDIPTGATYLHFTVKNTAAFDCVVLSNSKRIEDMEPEWVANDEHLCGVVGSTVNGNNLRACVVGSSTTANMSWTDFHYYSVTRGMQQIDMDMHSRIANLFYSKYGRRDSQGQCGAGSHTNMRKTGLTAEHGMQDTVGYEEARTVNANVTYSLVDGVNPQYAWYRVKEQFVDETVVRTDSSCCLGYENIYNHKWDMMDNVDVPNDGGHEGEFRLWSTDGTYRLVKGSTTTNYWITGVAHGKYMDVIPTGTFIGSSSSYYSDIYYISTSKSRVVCRGDHNAYAHGGVSCSHADYGSSYADANVGSRLAFRGKIVKAESVARYKALSDVALK